MQINMKIEISIMGSIYINRYAGGKTVILIYLNMKNNTQVKRKIIASAKIKYDNLYLNGTVIFV